MNKRMAAILITCLIFSIIISGCKKNTSDKNTSSNLQLPDSSASAIESEVSSTENNDSGNSSGIKSSSQAITNQVGGNSQQVNTPQSQNNVGTDGASTSSEEAPANTDYSTWKSAHLMSPMSDGPCGSQANQLRNTILNATSALHITGTTYYISMTGNDSNDGKSPKTAWRSISKLNGFVFKPGDGVLLERGGLWRTTGIRAQNGVSYGAYGSGAKPKIYGSYRNEAKHAWIKTSTPNVYRADYYWASREDIGNVIFNHGEAAGIKKYSIGELKTNFDFYHNYADGHLYLYLDKGSPDKLFSSIEVSYRMNIFLSDKTSDIHLDNWDMQYCGAHCVDIVGGTKNFKMTNCIIGWVGGSFFNPGDLSTHMRFGNGIEFWGKTTDVLMEHNYVYQVYDSGMTHQFTDETTTPDFMNNITYKENLIEYCTTAIEIWQTQIKADEQMKNTTVEGNIMRFAGYGWGKQRPNATQVGHLVVDTNAGTENMRIVNNIFDRSTFCLMNFDDADKKSTFSGNTFVCVSKGIVAKFNGDTIRSDQNKVRAIVDPTGTVISADN